MELNSEDGNILKAASYGLPEQKALTSLIDTAQIDEVLRTRIVERAVELVERIREDSTPSMMEMFLGEYGLSTDEGVALMCLAEALLRVPDGETMDALIEDKIASSQWENHLGHSHSTLVNASTWALFMTGKVLNEDETGGIVALLHGAIKRLGEPVIRQAVTRVMKELGRQFVLGETIRSAMKNARAFEEKGFTYSYDMLGEAAKTEADAKHYHLAYSNAISQLAKAANTDDIRQNPGISVKLSALHPRYETLQRERVMEELVPRTSALAQLAKSAGIGFNIDAEEAGRLDLSLDVIEAVLSDPALKQWDGFGVVVQAYSRRAPYVLDWLYALAERLDRRIMVRLVKGAYWDTEIKLAQVEGLVEFPVFTRKPSTDVSYICCAKKLLGMTDRIYPQFATHNAHTVAAILELAEDKTAFEFQRLHGMGEALHDTVLRRQGTRCRIYAPVGAHKDLLAYLVRRLLENGANSSFVNRIVDEAVPPQEVAADPFAQVYEYLHAPENPHIKQPADLFQPARPNSIGWDIAEPLVLKEIASGVSKFSQKTWKAGAGAGTGAVESVTNPATGETVGRVKLASVKEVEIACERARSWQDADAEQRATILNKAADLYEENTFEIFSILAREAGKTLIDCVGEIREAVDFLRYYAAEARSIENPPAGIFACISPWNFPLAIFTGQISAALAAGNAVIAKPAETTPLIAQFAVDLLHKAGVPDDVLQLLPGYGAKVGSALVSNPKINGVCFTGSTQTAQHINRSMAEFLDPSAPLIAETGGLNAMIVDSTALPEQAVTDVLASAFQSAGQRCSALRVLYLHADIAENFLTMLYGAMDELRTGNPQDFTTDIGPVIDGAAKKKIQDHIEAARAEGRLLKQLEAPDSGTFVGPAVLSVKSILDLHDEIFGPVLHVATFENNEFDQILADINATGYGLTFGFHSRIDDRVKHIIDTVKVGNLYINRNQIGAVVGSQPFGGEGMSGTGPKAGGPRYLQRFLSYQKPKGDVQQGKSVSLKTLQDALSNLPTPELVDQTITQLPGPTGETNNYSTFPKGNVLCLGPSAEQAQEQALRARALGCRALAVAPGVKESVAEGVINGLDGSLDPEALENLNALDAVVLWSDDTRPIREALAKRNGPIIPLLTDQNFGQWLMHERHVCIDTTAAGGNAALLDA